MSTAMNSVEENMRLMKTLDDAWNAQDWDTFDSRHAENVVVYWPGQPEPTRGGPAHRAESIEFFKTFPDNHVGNDPYKVLFGQGEWTCSVARFTGTMKGPMKRPDGTTIPPTNKSFEVEFCTVAHWQNGKIVEERLFYDLVGLMRQIGVG
jgi:ketosteroid isomerase-like protein